MPMFELKLLNVFGVMLKREKREALKILMTLGPSSLNIAKLQLLDYIEELLICRAAEDRKNAEGNWKQKISQLNNISINDLATKCDF